MPKRPTYILERTLPDGTVKTWPERMTLISAGLSVAHCLHDNLGITKAEAQKVGRVLEKTPVGQFVEAYGYKFRMVADDTRTDNLLTNNTRALERIGEQKRQLVYEIVKALGQGVDENDIRNVVGIDYEQFHRLIGKGE